MNQMKVATHVLNGRRVGYFADLVTLGSAETLKEALDYGYVTGKESSPATACRSSSTRRTTARPSSSP